MSARAQVLLAAVCFGTTGTAQALGPAASPVAVGAARIVLGGTLLVVIARGMGVRIPRLDATVLGIAVAIAIYQLSFFAAVKITGVAIGTVVAIGTGPAAAGLLGRLVNGERLTPRWALGTLACAAAGGRRRRAPRGRRRRHGRPGRHRARRRRRRGLRDLHRPQQAADRRARGDPGGHGPGLRAGGGAREAVMAAGFGGAAVLLVPVLLVAGPGFLTTGAGLGLAVYLGAIP